MAWIYEKYVDKIDICFDTFCHFSYVKTVWDSGIKLLKLRIRINFFKLWSSLKSTWDLYKTIILRCTYLLIAFEDFNSFILLTCFLYEKKTQSGSGKRLFLKVQSCKLYDNKYIIASTQIINPEIFVFKAVLVFKLLSR